MSWRRSNKRSDRWFFEVSTGLPGLSQWKASPTLVRHTETGMSKPDTKRAKLNALLVRKSGATIETLKKQLGWQPHTIRAEISRLRKGGLTVTRRSSSSGSVYTARPVSPAEDKT